MRKALRFPLSFVILAIVAFTGFIRPAMAEDAAPAAFSLQDILVTPTRIVFEGDMRSAELALVNRSDKVRSYALSFLQCRMTESGEIHELDPATKPLPGENFADPYVRFTPRRVVLEPRQVQMVRMIIRKPADLPDGEYRSHLNFRLIPSSEDATKPDSLGKGISIKLVPIYGVMIPVIVRQGALTARLRLTTLKLITKGEPATPYLSLSIEREGGQSSYGDLEVLWRAAGSKTLSLGMLRGVAVYTPNTHRIVEVPFSLPRGVRLREGQLSVRFMDHDIGAEKIFAESQLDLP